MIYNILIVDDSSMIRSSLRSWLAANSNCKVCGEAENGKEAVEKVGALHPDIVILDMQMPVMNGLDAARLISQLAPRTAMLMFTMHPSNELLKAARAAGIRDVVSKVDPLSDHLSSALRRICV